LKTLFFVTADTCDGKGDTSFIITVMSTRLHGYGTVTHHWY